MQVFIINFQQGISFIQKWYYGFLYLCRIHKISPITHMDIANSIPGNKSIKRSDTIHNSNITWVNQIQIIFINDSFFRISRDTVLHILLIHYIQIIHQFLCRVFQLCTRDRNGCYGSLSMVLLIIIMVLLLDMSFLLSLNLIHAMFYFKNGSKSCTYN